MKWIFVALLAASCGSSAPAIGSACTGTTGIVCQDDTVALDCYQGQVRAVPCVGPMGCTSSGVVECDVSTAPAGASCIAFTVGRCTSGISAILCTDQVLATKSCNVFCKTDSTGLECESTGL